MFEIKPTEPAGIMLMIIWLIMYGTPAVAIIWAGYYVGGVISERFSGKKSTASTNSNNKSKGARIGIIVAIIIVIAITWIGFCNDTVEIYEFCGHHVGDEPSWR